MQDCSLKYNENKVIIAQFWVEGHTLTTSYIPFLFV